MSRRMLTREGDTVDQLALEAYGRTGETTEALLDANPDLAGLGPLLPAGLTITAPELAAEPALKRVRLWE